MEISEIAFQYRGKSFAGQVAIPENLDEAIGSLGKDEVYACFRETYLEKQKRRIRLKRTKKNLKIEIAKLSDEQREMLTKAGLLPSGI